MSRTVEIPGGQITLRDPSELKQRHRRMMQSAAFRAAGAFSKLGEHGFDPQDPASIEQAFRHVALTSDEVDALMDMEEITILAFLESWTLAQPIPDQDTLGDLPASLYDAIKQATAPLGAGAISGEVDFEPSDPSAAGFTETPTTASGDFDGRSKEEAEAEAEPRSTGTPSSDGGSTDTAPYAVD